MENQTKERCEQLLELGLKFDGEFFKNEQKGIFIHHLDIMGYNQEKWNETIEKITKI